MILVENRNLLKVMSNRFSWGGGGAGFGVAKMLADRGVDIVVGGQFGENMKGALAETGPEYYEMTGCAKEAIIRFLDEAEK